MLFNWIAEHIGSAGYELAMIFTWAATAAAGTSLLAGTFFATATGIKLVALGLGLATTIGVSAVMRSLSGTAQEPADVDNMSPQTITAAAGDVPRSFQLGYSVTAGSMVWFNTWGVVPGFSGDATTITPNAYLTQVIALSDLPGCQLLELWVDGEKCTVSGATDPLKGHPITQYYKNAAGTSVPVDHLWIWYYDGTQTGSDFLCVNAAASAGRPYQSTRVGRGVCYAVITALTNTELFRGVPQFKFALIGIPLYDISKDSTAGGSGSHVYSNPSTWGGDGDNLPAVQAYNILRGIKYSGAWLYGLQNMTTAARLPAANWIEQIAKCRATVTGLGGPEPSYRSGGQVNVNTQPANAIEAILTACQGRLSEIGGFYKIHLGAPDASAFSWTDADLLSSEQQTFRPFFSLADSINGGARHPPGSGAGLGNRHRASAVPQRPRGARRQPALDGGASV